MSKPAPTAAKIARQLLELAESRADGKTFCPSEAARALATDWRPLMPRVRHVAATLVKQGRLRCTQKGKEVDPVAAHGAIRLAGR